MKTGKTLLWLTLFLFILTPGLRAVALEVPPLTGRINDRAGMLSRATEQQLDTVLANLEQEESTQIAVLTIPSLEGENLDEFTLKVAEKWGIGQKGRDNGALLLIARDDRKVRIEVGYGLEGRLTDLIAGRIIRNVITPNFKNGDFDQGVIDGVGAMIAAVRGEFKGGGEPSHPRKAKGDFEGLLASFAFSFFILGRIFARHRLVSSLFGAMIAPGLGLLFWGVSWLVLFLIPAGLIAGFLASLVFGSMRFFTGYWPSDRGGGSFGGFGGGGFSGGGFGGGSFGGGGFSGGGGGFGGGGSSGGW